MLDSIEVRNYQSLHKVELALSKFTVIVGPSSSGKSALMRSLRLLASNARGSSFVTHGQTRTSVSARLEDTVVTIERGEGHGTYRVTTGPEEQLFTKLGGSVPEEVTKALSIKPVEDGVSINFAGQFDRPYLLDDSGQTVARVFGELTNVSVIFDAVREANRRRLSSNGELKTRESDLAALKIKAAEFRTLKDDQEALEQAEQHSTKVQSLDARLSSLSHLLSNLMVAEAAVSRVQAEMPDPPDLTRLEEAHSRLQSFQLIITSLSHQTRVWTAADEQVIMYTNQELEAHQNLHLALVAAGTCPTCGQRISE